MNTFFEETVFIILVCGFALLLAASIFIVWSSRRTGWRNQKLTILKVLVLGFSAVGLCCFAYSFYEPYNLVVSTVEIVSRKLNATTGSIKIVHLTDMHSDGVMRLEKRLPAVVRSLKPDLVVFTGDSANNTAGLVMFRDCISEIAKVAPTFAVYGNHDSRRGRHWDIYGKTGVHLLDGTSESLDIRGTKVWISGVAVDNEGSMGHALDKSPGDAFSIFLYHYPAGIDVASAKRVDLFCAGHTHGGQVRLPLYGAVVTNSAKGKAFEYGLYDVGQTKMNVSRGIGMIGLPIRFLATPEVAVIEVRSP